MASSALSCEELQRPAVAHAVEVGAQGPHRRADRHVVVVEHHQQAGVGQVTGVVDRLEGHATGEGTVADHGHTLKSSPRRSRARAMPRAAEIEVLAWPAPKWSKRLSQRLR